MTGAGGGYHGQAWYFNSHAHVERDQFETDTDTAYAISTHTLTWSVTRNYIQYLVGYEDFNSHAHVERDRRLPD